MEEVVKERHSLCSAAALSLTLLIFSTYIYSLTLSCCSSTIFYSIRQEGDTVLPACTYAHHLKSTFTPHLLLLYYFLFLYTYI